MVLKGAEKWYRILNIRPAGTLLYRERRALFLQVVPTTRSK